MGLALAAGEAWARKSAAPTGRDTATHASRPPGVPATGDAFVELVPGTGGSVPAPVNSGTVTVGDRFVLDLMMQSGSGNTVGQQSYLTFTYSVLQNARVSSIGVGCVLTSTLTADLSTFDSAQQNEICDGPGNCVFRGVTVAPGSMAFADFAAGTCPFGCTGTFRIARIGLCAVAPGQAVLHWQFSPPAPITRDTEIVDVEGNLVHNPGLFTDYIINVVNPSILDGHVTWEGRPSQPNLLQQLPISLTLRLTTGGPYYDYIGMTTDGNGHFTVPLPGLPNGTYNWRVKNPQFLANAGTLTLSGAPVTPVEMGLMLAGDTNGDNVVGVVDFALLKGSFGRACGSPGFDPSADFTGDCSVNVVDFALLRSHFGHGGSGLR